MREAAISLGLFVVAFGIPLVMTASDIYFAYPAWLFVGKNLLIVCIGAVVFGWLAALD